MKIIAAAFAAVVMLGSPAHAQMRSREAPFSHLYIYGEYDYYTDSGKARGGGGGLGWNFNRYLGLQAGAQFLSSSYFGIAYANTDATLVYGEAKLSWPLMDGLSVYTSAGLAHADATSNFNTPYYPSPVYITSRSSTGYRIGVGTEYWFGRHWGLRAGWHQQNAGGVGSEIAGGIAFRF
jgi:opacity protein-like surface antigen